MVHLNGKCLWYLSISLWSNQANKPFCFQMNVA
uniref:Uncharacterized protein n=1 Tax=Anguilla anguilla TaxID=7936 RepID=A0A0E9UT39_ANGAN